MDEGYILPPEVIHHEIARLIADRLGEKQSDVFAESRFFRGPYQSNGQIEYRFEYGGRGVVMNFMPLDLTMKLDPFSDRFLMPAVSALNPTLPVSNCYADRS